jgi:hypothetical protein
MGWWDAMHLLQMCRNIGLEALKHHKRILLERQESPRHGLAGVLRDTHEMNSQQHGFSEVFWFVLEFDRGT